MASRGQLPELPAAEIGGPQCCYGQPDIGGIGHPLARWPGRAANGLESCGGQSPPAPICWEMHVINVQYDVDTGRVLPPSESRGKIDQPDPQAVAETGPGTPRVGKHGKQRLVDGPERCDYLADQVAVQQVRP